MNYQTLKAMLIADEANRLYPYPDTVGKLTIGVGRNLTDDGISNDESMFMLDNDIRRAIEALDRLLPWWRGMSDVRQHVIISMCFNMGIVRLMGFKKALAAMQSGDYKTAADEMQNSEWHEQVGPRAMRLAMLMQNDQ